MYPPKWDDVNRSDAERLIYRRLRDETPDDWLAFHSVGLVAHEFKSWAEADFVVVAPFGLICLEVKGGLITLDHGRWATNGHPLRESPFRQAGGAAAALRRELRRGLPRLRSRVESAVAFPDCRVSLKGPGVVQEIVYDASDVDATFRRFLERVFTYWRGRTPAGFQDRGELTRAERSLLASWLAPTITAVPSMRARWRDAANEFAELTERQAAVMRAMQSERRVLVRGGAGTGKTLLALREAERLAATGERVLLLCRSRPLAVFLAAEAQSIPGLVVADQRSVCEAILAAAPVPPQLPRADEVDLETLFLPEAAANLMIEAGMASPYSAVVIDEGQDLLLAPIIDCVDVLLEGGIETGTWRLFLDHKQDVFAGLDHSVLQRVDAAAASRANLIDNCRNTPEVAIATAILSATTPDELVVSPGPEVLQRMVNGPQQEAAAVREILRGWKDQGLTPDEVMVLGPSPGPPPHLVSAIEQGFSTVHWSGIDEFKGREAPAVLVTGLRDFDDGRDRRLAYIACSRAHLLLALVLPDAAAASLERRAHGFGEMLAGAGAVPLRQPVDTA